MSDRVETEPVIIEVAVNGVTNRKRNPHVPATDDELAKDALACIDGAPRSSTPTPRISWSTRRPRRSSTRPRSGPRSNSIRA